MILSVSMGVGILQASIDKLVKESEPLKLQNTVPGQVQKYLRASRRFSQELETISQEVDELRMNEFFNVQVLGKRTFQPPLPTISSGSIENDVLISSEINDTASACSEETRWIWVSSQHSATFSTRGQMRRGSAHGRGGRLPGSGAQVRRNYSSYARTVIYKRLYNLLSTCHDNNGNDVSPNGQALFIAQKMMHDLWSEHENDIPALGALSSRAVGENLLREVTDCSEQKLPTAIEHLPRGIMGIAARFTKSDFIEPTGFVRTARTYNVRERHVIATWVDRKGGVRCTCIGSTQYEIFAANDEFQDPCCMHAQAVVDVLKELCEKIFGISSIPIRILYNGFAAIYPEVLRDLNQAELPRFRSAHGGRTLLLIDEDTSTNDQLYWVPIRKVQRSGGRPLCAFCDLVSSNHCHHVKAYQKEHGEDFLVNFEPESSSGLGDTHEGNGIDETGTSNELTAFDTQPRDRNHQPISFLPLSPVNCRLAIRVDQHICDIMKEGGSLKVSAPLTCIYCEGQRIESTKETNTSGVVMCSLGACAMEIETYSCSTCTRRFSAEGRKEGLFIDSICLAATHKLLRDQLTGFALGNGTISSRLSQFHSQVAALEDSELFQTSANSRSTRSIYNLCVYVVRLMICEPPVSIFNCDTCQVDNVNLKKGVEHGRPLRAICVDGIWAGYQKKSVVPFENISQSCGPPTSFSRSVRSSFRKPKTSFLRLEKTVTFLINAIKGKAIEATHGSVPVIAAAVRIASETALPADFFVSSICGTFPTDYTNDIGNGCLKKLRELTTALFHRETVVYRLLEPLQKLFQRRGKRQKTVRRSTEKLTNSEAYTVVTTSISRISELVQIEEGVAWNEALLPFAKKADLGRKLLQLFTSLLQGPVTHLIRRDETSSAAALGNACIQYKPEDFMKAMAQKNFGEPSGAESALHEDQTSNILKNLRLFAAGLFSASVVDKKTKKDKKAGLLPAFGGGWCSTGSCKARRSLV